MHHHEMDSETGLELPTFGRTMRLFGRAFTLHCPNCGKGPVLQNWMNLRVRCGNCGLRMQRGEHDTVMGFVFILFTMVALAAYVALTITMLVTRETPWDLLEVGLPLLVLVLLFVFFPFAKLSWLAFDLMLRPVTAEEMAWHRSATRQFDTERDASR